MPNAELWIHRLRVGTAMAMLCWARLLVAGVPFKRWRETLGDTGGQPISADAMQLAKQVERAAAWLPFETQCLPRAMALSWLLRSSHIRHAIVFAVRPAQLRDSPDALHAWVEVGGLKIIGELPGPWLETLRIGS